MKIAFLTSSSSSLVNRILIEQEQISKYIDCLITTSKQPIKIPDIAKFTPKTININWKNNDSGSKQLSVLSKKLDLNIIILLFDKIINLESFRSSSIKLVNLHPSLLPSFKGLNAFEQAIKSGVCIQGATLHEITNELDSGPIYGQVAFPLDSSKPKAELCHQRHLSEYTLVVQFLHQIIKQPIYNDKNLSKAAIVNISRLDS